PRRRGPARTARDPRNEYESTQRQVFRRGRQRSVREHQGWPGGAEPAQPSAARHRRPIARPEESGPRRERVAHVHGPTVRGLGGCRQEGEDEALPVILQDQRHPGRLRSTAGDGPAQAGEAPAESGWGAVYSEPGRGKWAYAEGGQ